MPTFIIPYAHHTCTAEEVVNVFGTKLDIAILEVLCTVKTDRRTGQPFKTFDILTYPKERKAAYLADYIEKNGLTTVIYKDPYFWKVVNGTDSHSV